MIYIPNSFGAGFCLALGILQAATGHLVFALIDVVLVMANVFFLLAIATSRGDL